MKYCARKNLFCNEKVFFLVDRVLFLKYIVLEEDLKVDELNIPII